MPPQIIGAYQLLDALGFLDSLRVFVVGALGILVTFIVLDYFFSRR